MPLRLGLQSKMLLFTVGLVTLLTGLSLAVIQSVVIGQIQRRIALDLAETQAVFRKFMAERVVWLRSQCEIVAEDPRFLATLDLQAPFFQAPNLQASIIDENARTVLREAKQFRNLINSDVFMVTDPRGLVLARIDVFQSIGDTLLAYPTVQSALKGTPATGRWEIKGHPYEVSTIPVREGNRIIGTLSIGYEQQIGLSDLAADLTRLADQEHLSTALASARTEDLLLTVQAIEKAFGCDLLTVTGLEGNSRITRIHRTNFNVETVPSPWTQSALNGQYANGFQTDNNRIIQMVAVPVWSADGLIGTLSAGFEINDQLAYGLRDMTHSAVSFAVNGRVIASTWPEKGRRELERALLSADAPLAKASVTDLTIDAETYSSLVGAIDFGDPSRKGLYVIQVSVNQAVAFLAVIQRVLLVVGAAILIVSGLISFWGVTRVVQPVRLLVDGTRRLASGDLTYRIPVPSNDEIGQLAGSFNVMVEALGKSDSALTESTDALRASEKLYLSTFNEAPVGIVHTGITGQLLRMNKRYCEIADCPQEALLANSLQNIIHPEDVAESERVVAGLLSGELPTQTLEERYIRRDESIVWTVRTVSLNRNALGEPDYFINVVEDVSQRKQLESQLLQSQKMEAIGRLAGGVAHDFNNMLTVINGFADLLIKKLAGEPSLRQQAQGIRKAGERAAGLTSQLLAFSRRQVLQPKVINLNDVVTDNMKLFERLIGEDVQVVCNLEPTLWRVKADPIQMVQVVMNLAVNARDAMPRGGTLTVETHNVQLDEHDTRLQLGNKNGPHVALTVTDTGCGIEQQVLAHIFEPFFTTKEVGKGTGLGLSTVYGIVQQTNGDIAVDSAVGAGTSFHIFFPSVEETNEVLEVSDVAPTRRDISETILLVEDEESVRDLTYEILSGSGYTVLEASNGVEALQLGERYSKPIHLMVTDVVMPQMSGPELAGRMTALRPEMKVLYMSGYTRDFISQHSMLESGVILLQKPYTPEDLESKVREILDSV